MNDIEEKKLKVEKISKELRKIFPHAKIALNYSTPWELLVAVMLSAQCTDKLVNKVTEKLFVKYPTFDDYLKANAEEFEKDVSSVNFYRNKAKNILKTAQIIHETFSDKVPNTMEDLLSLPGVARKTANVVLANAYNILVGIAVDTHVKRLSNLLGLTTHDDPVKIEQDLMKIVPQKDWKDFTYLLIDYGRAYCTARPHNHEKCPLYGF